MQTSRTPFSPTTPSLRRSCCPAGGRCRQTQHCTACSGGARGQTPAALRSPREMHRHRRVGEGGAVSPTGRACRRGRRLARRPQGRRLARRPQRMPRRRRMTRRRVQSRLDPGWVRRKGPRESRRCAGAMPSPAPAPAPPPLARRGQTPTQPPSPMSMPHGCLQLAVEAWTTPGEGQTDSPLKEAPRRGPWRPLKGHHAAGTVRGPGGGGRREKNEVSSRTAAQCGR